MTVLFELIVKDLARCEFDKLLRLNHASFGAFSHGVKVYAHLFGFAQSVGESLGKPEDIVSADLIELT